MKVNDAVIKRVLVENNISIRSNQAYKCKPINVDYFDKIDTQNKAYILGFIYADGCISYNNKIMSIKIHIKDIALLEKMKCEFESGHKIVTGYSNSGYSNHTPFCMLSIANKEFVQKLNKLGVMQRKSKILTFPSIDIVPEKYQRHFIRGYFDGDGSIYHVKQGNTYGMSFTGTENMLTNISSIINLITKSKARVHKYKNKEIYDLKYGGRNLMRKIYQFLYTDAEMYLERKHELFKLC